MPPRQALSIRATRAARASLLRTQQASAAARTTRRTRAPSAGQPSRATNAAESAPAAILPVCLSIVITVAVTVPHRVAAEPAALGAGAARTRPAGRRSRSGGGGAARRARVPKVLIGIPRRGRSAAWPGPGVDPVPAADRRAARPGSGRRGCPGREQHRHAAARPGGPVPRPRRADDRRPGRGRVSDDAQQSPKPRPGGLPEPGNHSPTRLTCITSAGQRTCDAAAAAGGKTHLPPGDLTGAHR